MTRISLAMSLVSAVWIGAACSSSIAPTAPSASVPVAGPADTLSGVVFRVTPSGPVPGVGARVATNVNASIETDENGAYSILAVSGVTIGKPLEAESGTGGRVMGVAL